jgi:hypothetical protein
MAPTRKPLRRAPGGVCPRARAGFVCSLRARRASTCARRVRARASARLGARAQRGAAAAAWRMGACACAAAAEQAEDAQRRLFCGVCREERRCTRPEASCLDGMHHLEARTKK